MRLISQLINGISKVPQKLLKYFNDPAISTCCLLSVAGVFPVSSIDTKGSKTKYFFKRVFKKIKHMC